MQKDLLPENSRHERCGKALSSGFRILLPERILSPLFVRFSPESRVALIDDITHAVIKKEIVIEQRHYHTIKEVKNGEGPHPIKTPQGWLHLAHGVRACAAGLRYVLYLYMTSLDDPRKVIAQPGGYFMAPVGEERTGDVSNVLFSNGWIADEDGTVYIYYASSDTRMHVATSTIERLIDYCRHTPEDRLRSTTSVKSIYDIIEANKLVMSENAVVL